MAVRFERFSLSTRGDTDIHDLTGRMQAFLAGCGVRDGLVTAFVAGSTAAITTVEFEPGLVRDLAEYFERVASRALPYHHHGTWNDDNGHAHVRASTLGQSFSVPAQAGRLLLGTWQQVVLIDFDTRPRTREVTLQAIGE